MIPGLEFKDGLCPMCQTKEIVTDFKSVLLVINQVVEIKNRALI